MGLIYHYYDRRVPIHALEVITELVKQGVPVTLITAIDPKMEQYRYFQEISLINLHTPWARGGVLRLLAFLLASIPALVTAFLKNPGALLYCRVCGPSTLLAAGVGRALGRSVIVEYNGIVREETKPTDWIGRLRMATNNWCEWGVFRLSTYVITVTEGIREWIRRTFQREGVYVVENGVNLERFHPMDGKVAKRVLHLEPESLVIGYLGGIKPWCGLQDLVEAASLLKERKDVHYLIGGGYQADEEKRYYEGLKRRVEALGLSTSFTFYGPVPWSKAAEFISSFDIAVVPARFYSPVGPSASIPGGKKKLEASPQKLYAYMACEKCVVASDLEGLGDFLEDNSCGASFPEGNVSLFADALLDLIKDAERRKCMGERALKLAQFELSWESRVKQLRGIIGI